MQLEPAARLLPQVLPAREKSPASAPPMAMLPMLTADVPPFTSVTVCAFPCEPTATDCHETSVGLTNTATTETQPVCGSAQTARNTPTTSALNRVLGVRVEFAGRGLTFSGVGYAEAGAVNMKKKQLPTERRMSVADVQRRELHAVSIRRLCEPFQQFAIIDRLALWA